MAIIYKITNLINQKIYIGETTRSLNKRWNEHKHQSLVKGHGYNYHLHCAIRKYGIENFKIEIIEECPDEQRFIREHYYIVEYNSMEPEGYNFLASGTGSIKIPIEDIIEAWNMGLNCKQIGEKLGLGRQAVSEHLKNYGISQDEIYKRQGEFTAQRCGYPVLQYDLNGNFIKEFPSASSTGYQQSAISSVCRQEQYVAYGYIWKYKNDERDIQEWINRLKDKNKNNKKRIYQYDINMNLINIYESATEAAKALNLSDKSNICRAARVKGKSAGFYWRYEEDKNE